MIQNWSHVLSALRRAWNRHALRRQWPRRQSPDQAGDMAAELAGWTSGELPGQVTEQLVSWPPGLPSAADQPPTSA